MGLASLTLSANLLLALALSLSLSLSSTPTLTLTLLWPGGPAAGGSAADARDGRPVQGEVDGHRRQLVQRRRLAKAAVQLKGAATATCALGRAATPALICLVCVWL